MRVIKVVRTVPNVLLYDSKNDPNYNIVNETDEIEQILSGLPITYRNYPVGFIGHCQNRGSSSLYYGEVKLTHDIGEFEELKVVHQEPDYKFLNNKDVILTHLITEVDKVES